MLTIFRTNFAVIHKKQDSRKAIRGTRHMDHWGSARVHRFCFLRLQMTLQCLGIVYRPLSVPPKHVMNFACAQECTLFVYTDGPFALHYVDEGGNEISPTAALQKK
jgi:hypothetical protein